MDPETAQDAAQEPEGTPEAQPSPEASDSDQGGKADPADRTGWDESRWKVHARKHESENERLKKELATMKAAQMTESEKAIADAEERGRQAALTGVRTELAEARLRVAAAGKVSDVDALVELVDVNRFITDEGIDSSAIEAAVDRFVKALPAPTPPKYGSVELGPQGDRPRQLTQDDLKSMSPEQINQARRKGQLDHMLRT